MNDAEQTDESVQPAGEAVVEDEEVVVAQQDTPVDDAALRDTDNAEEADEADGTDESDVLDDGLGAPTLAAALEALLMVTEQPMQPAELASLVRCPEADVIQTLERIAQEYTVLLS